MQSASAQTAEDAVSWPKTCEQFLGTKEQHPEQAIAFAHGYETPVIGILLALGWPMEGFHEPSSFYELESFSSPRVSCAASSFAVLIGRLRRFGMRLLVRG
jgi:hypothetical protein